MLPIFVAVSILVACTTNGADEGDPTCINAFFVDVDGDGHGDPTAALTSACTVPDGYAEAGDDCDDADPAVHGGADETCDARDNDCDEDVDEDAVDAPTWFRDEDFDEYGDSEQAIRSCDVPSGHTELGEDCDDSNAGVNPGVAEICNEVDDDCDALVDMDDPSIAGAGAWYDDADADGYGDSLDVVLSCVPIAGSVDNALDCDDTDLDIRPGAWEVCDASDNDCDELVDDADPDVHGDLVFYADTDGDGLGDPDVIADACTIVPKGFVDNEDDCDDTTVKIGEALEYYWDSDLDGYGFGPTSRTCTPYANQTTVGGDCRAYDATSYPGAVETCDDHDNNCDGLVDDADPLVVLTTSYADDDADGFGDPGDVTDHCGDLAGYVESSGDCDDADDTVNPAATEFCDSIDNDCTGLVDDGVVYSDWYADDDADGYGDDADVINDCVEPSGYLASGGDCDDTSAEVNPDADEVCGNGADDDCDASADNCQIDLADADLTLVGYVQGLAGICLATGDLDADGTADLVLGAPYTGTDMNGEAYVLYGPATGLQSTADLPTVSTTTAGQWLGSGVAAGDADHDSFDDLLVGASQSGATYLFLGPVTGALEPTVADASFAGAADAGSTLDVVADMDGDGLPDMLIAAPHAGLTGVGWVYVASATSTGAVDLSTDAIYTYTGPGTASVLGWSMADAGDLDGDGVDELALGAPAAAIDGKVYVMQGGTAPGIYDAELDALVILEGDTTSFFGQSIAAADYDGDGASDLFVGAGYAATAAGDRNGAVYAFLGPVSGTLYAASDASTVWEASGDAAGLGTVEAGDIDGDTNVDVLLGAPSAYAKAGGAYVQLGLASGVVETGSLLSFVGEGQGWSGYSLALLPDWHGDGGAEIVVGSPRTLESTAGIIGSASVFLSDSVPF